MKVLMRSNLGNDIESGRRAFSNNIRIEDDEQVVGQPFKDGITWYVWVLKTYSTAGKVERMSQAFTEYMGEPMSVKGILTNGDGSITMTAYPEGSA